MDTQIMEASTLLKHLDELNEEAQQIQNEIHQISNSLTTQQYEEEKTKTLITSFIKRIMIWNWKMNKRLSDWR